MNKQELLKQADYTFQRGNRELAQKYLAELLTQYPNDESAWMLMARMVAEKERRVECYERVLKLNPNNAEARLGLIRIKSPDKTLPLHGYANSSSSFPLSNPIKNILRSVVIIAVFVMIFGTTTYVVALKNPESGVAKLIIPATPTALAQPLADNIAVQTRAQVSAKYPQYAPLVDALISLAVSNAKNGMEGAPERPGDQIVPSDAAGAQAKTSFENALPQPGSLNTVTLTELEITSWLALEMRDSPDLPLQDVQVYLRNGDIQIWGIVKGSDNQTSALITGTINLDTNGQPAFKIDSFQIGQQVIPTMLLSQAEAWLNQFLSEKINEQTPGLKVMNVNISNGLITISGMR
jgi:tetratricopeptide (TPR) repeat protein